MTTERPKRKHPEDALQRSILDYLRWASLPDVYTCAIPNGGQRAHLEAAIMVGLGVRKGSPDLLIVGQDGRAHFIEVKAPNGRLSPEQRDFRDLCERRGWPYALVRHLHEAEAFCRAHGLVRTHAKEQAA